MLLSYRSTKTYGHSAGLSCAFRQWRADSHCRQLHGYALAVRVEFAAGHLDERNWVVDFGALRDFKAWLEETFDHATIVAIDDPELEWFRDGAARGVLRLVEAANVGCEAFAEAIFVKADDWLRAKGLQPRCTIASVEVREHDGNSASVHNIFGA
jgi:6-pyruvoyltetrahydropterin/6-carboxytetrahydropterin synthase